MVLVSYTDNMPIPIVWPMAAYSRWAVTLAEWAAGYLWDQLASATVATDIEWRRIQVIWERIGDQAAEDAMVCTFDLLLASFEADDGGWSSTEYDAADARFVTFLTTLAGMQPGFVRAVELRWYRQTFKPLAQGGGIEKVGAPVRVTPLSITGGASGAGLPGQVALSVTERTPLARHWGRFYLPGFSTGALTSSGRWASATYNNILAATDTLYTGLHGDSMFPVVPVSSIDNAPAAALLGVTAIQIDDVPDVIRSRRVRENIVRVELPV